MVLEKFNNNRCILVAPFKIAFFKRCIQLNEVYLRVRFMGMGQCFIVFYGILTGDGGIGMWSLFPFALCLVARPILPMISRRLGWSYYQGEYLKSKTEDTDRQYFLRYL